MPDLTTDARMPGMDGLILRSGPYEMYPIRLLCNPDRLRQLCLCHGELVGEGISIGFGPTAGIEVASMLGHRRDTCKKMEQQEVRDYRNISIMVQLRAEI